MSSQTFVVLTVFLLGLFWSSTVSARCPAEVIKPCECVSGYFSTNVQCSNFTDMASLQVVFDNSVDYPFDHFILRESNIMYLNASWLTTKTIQHLTIENSSLVGFFEREPDTLEMVSVINLYNVSLLRGVQFEYFKPLVKLLELNMEDVEVRKLGKQIGANMSPVFRQLKVWRGKTSQMDDDVFQNLTRMRVVEIRYSQVKTLKRSMFANPSKMFSFDFSYNQIEVIPSDIFDGMPELANVYLMGNKLVTIPLNMCPSFFYMLENPLVCDCKLSWMPTRKCFIYGTCEAPANMKGKQLSRLTDDDFSYC